MSTITATYPGCALSLVITVDTKAKIPPAIVRIMGITYCWWASQYLNESSKYELQVKGYQLLHRKPSSSGPDIWGCYHPKIMDGDSDEFTLTLTNPWQWSLATGFSIDHNDLEDGEELDIYTDDDRRVLSFTTDGVFIAAYQQQE